MSEIQIPEVAAKPASNPNAAILTGAALLGGAALLARPKAARAQTSRSSIPFTEQIFGSKASDFLVLNYALSLEALETELYVQALQRLTTGGNGGQYALSGLTITGLNQSESSAAVQYLREFGKVELGHRNFLNTALGSNSILSTGMALDGAKFDFGLGSTSTSVANVVDLVRSAEALGVQAYIGAIPFFSSIDSVYLQTAAAIQGTEARHTAVITAILNGLTGQSAPVAPLTTSNDGKETPMAPQQVLDFLRVTKGFIVLNGETGNTDADNN